MALLFSPAGVWTATRRLTNTFEIGIDPDELTGTAEANFFDTNGICSRRPAQPFSAVAWNELDEQDH